MGKHDKDIFARATSIRDQLTKKQAEQIRKLYVGFANDIDKRINEMLKKGTPSAALEAQYLQTLKKQIEEQSKQVTNEVYATIRKNMNIVSDSVVSDAVGFMSGLGFDSDGVNAALSSIPQSSVNAILNGNVYKGGWNLSKALWGSNEDNLRKVYQIIAQGQVEQLGIKEIADMLSEYLNPDKKLEWTGPNGMKIYGRKTDYASQRLARTLLQHTYQQTFVATVKDNPFVEKVRWVSNGPRVCDICKKRDGKLFDVDNVPLDHPNGMCVLEPVVDDNMYDDLAKWVKGEKLPAKKKSRIDYLAERFGLGKIDSAKSKQKLKSVDEMTLDEIISSYGDKSMLKYKSPSKWYKSLPPDVQAKVSKLHHDSGMKWSDWYKKNVAKFDVSDIVDVADDIIDDSKSKLHDVDLKPALPSDKFNSDSIVSKIMGYGKDNYGQEVNKLIEKILDHEKKLFDKMPDNEASALKTYTGHKYSQINEWLRNEGKLSDARKYDIDDKLASDLMDLMKTMKKKEFSTDKEIIVRRGTDFGDIAGLFMEYNMDNIAKLDGMTASELNVAFAGMTGKYKGFTSTSSLYDRGFGGEVEIIIKCPPGTPGMSIMSKSRYDTEEGEFLLAPGTEVVCKAIEKSDYHKGSKIRVFLEVLV